MRGLRDKIATVFFWGAALVLGALLVGILGFIVDRGWRVLSWDFIFEPPRDGMTQGGVWTPLVGTLELTVVSMLATIPVGVGTGLYFSEYATDSFFTRVLRQSIRALAGVPAVVFGLFGLSFFVIFLRLGSSMLSASLTLACLCLPLMVTAAEQAFRAVPRDYRDAFYALGATKWQTIRKVVFPSALETIITGVILSIGRVAGETAPIIFTGAAFYTPGTAESLFDEVMALPYHVYVLATAGTGIEATRGIQYGAILVLVGLVLGISSVGIWMRGRLNKDAKIL
jgi:phosphate transport system permease protein